METLKINICPQCGCVSVKGADGSRCLFCGRTDVQSEPAPRQFDKTKQKKYRTETENATTRLLKNEGGSLDYFRGRTPDLSDEQRIATIQTWHLGFELKLGQKNDICYSNRLIFPIVSSDGKHIDGFGGRLIVPNENYPKYFNSNSEDEGYVKGESLFGYYRVPEKARHIFLCEGYMDAVSMSSAGLEYPVASLGTALTDRQAQMLKEKNPDTVVVCYDADDAGRKAVMRAIPILWKAGFDNSQIRVAVIDGAKDVDEALHHAGSVRYPYLRNYLLECGTDASINLFADSVIHERRSKK